MRFLLSGAPDDSLSWELGQLGHEVFDLHPNDWLRLMQTGASPKEWGDAATSAVRRHRPDVFVLFKGAFWQEGGQFWKVPQAALYWIKQHVGRMVYVSYDDPAWAPIAIQEEIVRPFDFWLTSCPGIEQIFAPWANLPVVREFWLAWDRRIPLPVRVDPELEVDLAVTGSSYYRPFESPHYRAGFGFPRRDFVHAVLAAGYGVGIWGPRSWLDPRLGGDPSFESIYRGWISPTRVHVVHRSAKVVLGTQLVEGWRYESGRCVWIGGAGGCLLHESRPGLEEEFGGSVAWFRPGDIDKAIEKLKFLLENPEIRVRMASDLQKVVLERHTSRHRAERLVEIVLER